jgi:hypothetical protein
MEITGTLEISKIQAAARSLPGEQCGDLCDVRIQPQRTQGRWVSSRVLWNFIGRRAL